MIHIEQHSNVFEAWKAITENEARSLFANNDYRIFYKGEELDWLLSQPELVVCVFPPEDCGDIGRRREACPLPQRIAKKL